MSWLSIRSPPAVWLAKSRHSGETFASPLLSFVESTYDCGLDSQVCFNVGCHFTVVGMRRSDLDEGNSVQFVIIRQIHANRPLSSVHCRHVSGTVHAYLTYIRYRSIWGIGHSRWIPCVHVQILTTKLRPGVAMTASSLLKLARLCQTSRAPDPAKWNLVLVGDTCVGPNLGKWRDKTGEIGWAVVIGLQLARFGRPHRYRGSYSDSGDETGRSDKLYVGDKLNCHFIYPNIGGARWVPSQEPLTCGSTAGRSSPPRRQSGTGEPCSSLPFSGRCYTTADLGRLPN